MTKREFLGDELYLLMKQDYDALRAERNSRKGKPDQYDMVLIRLSKIFEAYYKPWVTGKE